MKVRIGFGLGTQGIRGGAAAFATVVDGLERLGFDSLWLSERLTGATVDPVVGCAFAAGRTTRLKFGFSVLVLPGRNPVVLAKELASLDVLSGGRLLPAFGLGVAEPAEQQAFGVQRGERAAWCDEVLPLLRRLWTGEPVDHHGPRFSYEGLRILPAATKRHMDVWLGGRAPSELRRIGRLADGWLPSFMTPDEAAEGKVAIEAAAAETGRAIDPEHFGALLPYSDGPLPEAFAARLRARRPDIDPASVVPAGLEGLRKTIEAYIERGFSKFVVLPLAEPPSWDDALADLAAAILPLESFSST